MRQCCLEADAGDDFQHGPIRNLGVISEMLAESGLPAEVKERSIAVFTALGEAEAKTHGSTLDQVGNVIVAFGDCQELVLASTPRHEQ